MRITWRPEFEPSAQHQRERFAGRKNHVARQIAETTHVPLEQLEADLRAFLLNGIARIHGGIHTGDVPAFDNAEVESLEARGRSILLDPSLSRHQRARLERIQRAVQIALPLARLGGIARAALQPLRPVEPATPILDRLKAVTDSVQIHADTVTKTIQAPGPEMRALSIEAGDLAGAAIRDADSHLRSLLRGTSWRMVRATLLVLEIAHDCLDRLGDEYAVALDAERLNRFGPPSDTNRAA